MPYAVRKSRTKAGGYDIVNRATRRKVGHSSTKAKAQSSARARGAGAHGWKPKR
jgi:hypothetical protein